MVGKCECGRVAELAEYKNMKLCYGCWHAEREKEQPYHVCSKADPDICLHGNWEPMVCTHEEAIQQAKKANSGKPHVSWRKDYRPVKADSWDGARLAHPGYMTIRQKEILGV